jgi:hypothetical protein
MVGGGFEDSISGFRSFSSACFSFLLLAFLSLEVVFLLGWITFCLGVLRFNLDAVQAVDDGLELSLDRYLLFRLVAGLLGPVTRFCAVGGSICARQVLRKAIGENLCSIVDILCRSAIINFVAELLRCSSVTFR